MSLRIGHLYLADIAQLTTRVTSGTFAQCTHAPSSNNRSPTI